MAYSLRVFHHIWTIEKCMVIGAQHMQRVVE